jgi:DNA-binding MarR family transcriptional regulator
MAFDSLVTSAGRLRILAALAAQPRQPFVRLREHTGLTDGNLSTHARRLQAAGLVEIQKTIQAGKPLTTLELTRQGREALTTHAQSLLSALEGQATSVESAEAAVSDWVD